MKKLLLLSIITLLFFVALPNNVEARSGCCSWHGGVCGCQCCDGTPLSSTCLPYYPECWGGGLYDYPSYDFPSYDYPSYTPSIPDCPLNSYYDSLTDSCKCYSGYVVSEGKCISTTQYCWDLYGLFTTYDILSDSCKCMSGYVFGEDLFGKTTCVSADQACEDQYGYHSSYNYLTDKCKCDYGYIFGKDILGRTQCIDADSYCHDKHGIHSSYETFSDSCKCDYGYMFNSFDQCVSRDDYCEDLYGYNAEYSILSSGCVCEDGYEFQNNRCVEITPVIYSFYPTIVRAGESITVSGNNFGDYKGDVILNTLSFGILGKISSLDIKSWNNNQIKFIVPEDKEPDEYYIRIEPSWTFSSKEAVSKNKLEVLMPLPEIYSIYSLEAEIGEEVTISGENFGDSKYNELNLYIGNTKVSSGNITSWWDNKIVFEITDDLESGYVILKDNNFSNPTVIQGSYLEVIEPEEDFTPIYTFKPKQESEQEPESGLPQQEEIQTEEQQESLEFQPVDETQLETQPDTEKSQPSEIQESENKEQQEVNNEQEQEQKQDQKRSLSVFLASVFDAIKNFFLQLFR